MQNFFKPINKLSVTFKYEKNDSFGQKEFNWMWWLIRLLGGYHPKGLKFFVPSWTATSTWEQYVSPKTSLQRYVTTLHNHNQPQQHHDDHDHDDRQKKMINTDTDINTMPIGDRYMHPYAKLGKSLTMFAPYHHLLLILLHALAMSSVTAFSAPRKKLAIITGEYSLKIPFCVSNNKTLIPHLFYIDVIIIVHPTRKVGIRASEKR